MGARPSLLAAAACAWLCSALLFAPPATAKVAGGGLAIVGVRAIPAPDAAPIADAVILVKGDQILRIGPRRSTPVPPGYRVVGRPGQTAVAGFWNSHVHLTRPVFLKGAQASDGDLQAELDNDFTRWGFTTVFDLASTSAVAQAVKARLAEGRVTGPRLLSVGEPFYPPAATPIYARPFYEDFHLPSAEIRSPAEAALRAERQLRGGDDGVKLFTGSILGGPGEVAHMRPEAVRAITAVARRLHKPAFAHPTDREGLEVAVRNGVGVLAHAAPLMGPWSDSYARGIAARKVALIPTLALYADAANPATPAAAAVQQTRAFAAAGGVVLFGTDAGFTDAFDTSTEMRLMQEAVGWRGLLASLTTAPARLFGDARRGRIAPKMAADLVLLDGDPSRDVAAMSRVRMVIRAGEVIFDRP